MGFEPKNITKEHIAKAVCRIEKEKIELIASTKFDVLIDGNSYPPKDLLRYGHEELNGENIWEITGGEPTNKFLKNMGFEITSKSDPLQDLISDYKKHIAKSKMLDEVYKWDDIWQLLQE